MPTTDRRVQRTRDLLQKALIELVRERDYDAITIQDIVDRANIGRTTFYLHYHGKDDLFLSCHDAVVSAFHYGPRAAPPLSRDDLLAPEPSPGTIAAFQHLNTVWARLSPIFQGRDGPLLLRRLRDSNAQAIEANVRSAFAGAESAVPLDVLATYLAGAQIAVVQWWLEKRRPHSPDVVALTFHRLQRAALRDAFGLSGDE